MIKNDRQLSATKKQLAHLRAALTNARTTADQNVFVGAHIQALETDIARLEKESLEYERFKSQEFDLGRLQKVDNIGHDLVEARIASDMTQADLAHAVGKKEQLIQRYESTKYRKASLATMAAIAGALLSTLQSRARSAAKRARALAPTRHK